MSVQLQANKEPVKVTPSQLFDEALPKAIEMFQDQATQIKATYLINIFGEGGGNWFVDPKNAVVRVADNDEADCVLEMGVSEFSDLTTGKLDTSAAIAAGKMRFSGDPDQLIAFGALLGG
jgi:predicted lipid carrier protein YhbT